MSDMHAGGQDPKAIEACEAQFVEVGDMAMDVYMVHGTWEYH